MQLPLHPTSRPLVIPFWLGIFGHATAANAVRVFALLTLAETTYRESAITLIFSWLLLSAVPVVLLTPLVGAMAGCGARRGILVFCCLAGIGATLACFFQNGPWLGCLGILAIETAFFSATRQAMVPMIARQTWWSLPQLQAVFGVAVLGGAVAGIWLALEYDPRVKVPSTSLPLPLQGALVGYGVAIVGVLLARFRLQAEWVPRDGIVVPFLETVGLVLRTRFARISLLLLLGWYLLLLLLLGKNYWLLSATPGLRTVETFGVALVVGVVVGGLLHFHPFRASSIVPPALTGLFGCLVYSVAQDDWVGPAWPQGVLLGCMVMPLLTLFQSQLPMRRQAHALAYLYMGMGIVTAGVGMTLLRYRFDSAALDQIILAAMLILCGAMAAYTWFALFLPFVETVGEYCLLPMHRISHTGPGVWTMPWNEPVLIIANHAAMLDPLWLSVVVPQTTRPMMISTFYDLPVISWLMRKVIRTIRVQDSLFRREAPEVQEAIRALKAGDSVMIFPEGWLRREDEVAMRRFSRGVWQILKAVPQTPVYAFWIEGGWGSFFSFKGGPLMKGKPLDKLRRIRIAGLEGRVVDPKILENHLRTRGQLMEWVLEARSRLNLPPIDPKQFPHFGEDEPEGGRA